MASTRRLVLPVYVGLLVLAQARPGHCQGRCSLAPTARLDAVFLDEGRDAVNGRYSVVLPLLANDSSATGEPLAVGTIDSPSPNPAGGTIRREPNGTIFFEGDVGAVGTRLFGYRAQGSGQTAEGTVWIFEGGVTVPLYDARDDHATVAAGEGWAPLTVLSNDLVAAGRSAVIASFASRTRQGGWVRRVTNAVVPTLEYLPPSSAFAGTDDFLYTGQVSGTSDSATVFLTVQPGAAVICWIVGRRPGLGPLDFQIDTSCSLPDRFRQRCFHFGDEANPNAEDCAAPNTPGAPFVFAHSYPALGSYELRGRFTRSDGGPDSTRAETFRITDARPMPHITVGDCVRTACQLSAWQSEDNDPIASYAWSFGDGSPIVLQRDVTHDFGSLGDYLVILVVTDMAGQSEAITRIVSLVDQPPSAHFTATCSPSEPSCDFTSISSDDFLTIASHEWRWENLATGASGVLSTAATARLTAPTPGAFRVTLTVTDSAQQSAAESQHVTLAGALTARPDWLALPATSNTLVFDPRENDFGPAGPFVVESVEAPRFGTARVLPTGLLEYVSSGIRPVAADRFGYTLRNGSGQRAQGVIRVVSRPVAEVGRLSALTHVPRTVKLNGAYPETPLLFFSPVTANEADWVRPRLTQLEPGSFTVFLEEPPTSPYDGTHAAETVDYLAVLPVWNDAAHQMGSGQLEGGLRYVAGRTVVTYPPDLELPILRKRIRLPPELMANGRKPPVVLAEIQVPGPGQQLTAGVTVRIDELTEDGFSLSLEALEGESPGGQGVEVAWIAFEPLVGHGAESFFEVGQLTDVTDAWRSLALRQPYFAPPVFLAGFQGHDDPDPAIPRLRGLTARSVELRAQEDLTADPETTHGPELTGYLAFESPGAIFGGAPVDLLFTVPGEHALTATDDLLAMYLGENRVLVLENDTAGAGSLEVVWIDPRPTYGTTEILPGGSIVYTPFDPRFTGDDEFGYIIRDATGSTASARVFILGGSGEGER